MSLDRILNLSEFLPTPPVSQLPAGQIAAPAPSSQITTAFGASSSTPDPYKCQGCQGEKSQGHSHRKNAGCPNNACFECCKDLYKQCKGCQKHATQLRKKQKAKDKADPVQAIEPGPTQAGHIPLRRLSSPNMLLIRSICIRDQAAKRSKQADIQLSEKTVTIVVWPGLNPNQITRTWRVVATNWPIFSLNQCEGLKKLVETELPPQTDLLIWNYEMKDWVKSPITTMEIYPTNCRKVLVVFPGLNPATCPGLDEHLQTTTTKPSINKFDLTPFLSTPVKSRQAPRVVHLDLTEDEATPRASSHHIAGNREPVEDQLATTTIQRTKRARETSPTVDQEDQLDTPTGQEEPNQAPPWPASVTMGQMVQFFEKATVPVKIPDQEAFTYVFGNTYEFQASTVSTYRRWLERVQLPSLKEYVRDNGHKSVAEGKKHYNSAWRTSHKTKPMKPKKKLCLGRNKNNSSQLTDSEGKHDVTSPSNEPPPTSDQLASGLLEVLDVNNPIPLVSSPTDSRTTNYVPEVPLDMLRHDLVTKQAAILYRFSPIPYDVHFLVYDPVGLNTYKKSIVMYNCKDLRQPNFNWDHHDWTIKSVGIESSELHNPMVAKYNEHWLTSSNLAREHALELGQSNLYVRHMLYFFQHALQDHWLGKINQSGYRQQIRKDRVLHAQSLGLQVPMPCLLQTIGQKNRSGWLFCEDEHHHKNHCYVHEYKFVQDQPEDDPWEDLIHAFIHHSYHHSKKQSLIAQLDCDIGGQMSNLICFTRG
ncbi:hypothetical protein DFH28DRAFT_915673 [Melampsora americana]|nr:hypothetical protein DFH28DRAFT_915673 [Melampsora americana]